MSKLNLNTLAIAGLSLLFTGTSMAYESSLGNKTAGASVHGLVQLDSTIYANTKGGQSGTDLVNSYYRSGIELRRAKIALTGNVNKNWSYEMGLRKPYDYDNVALSPNVKFDNVRLTWTNDKDNLSVSIGQMARGFGLENAASPTHRNFLEMSLAGGLLFDIETVRGLRFTGNTDKFMFDVMGYFLDRKSGDVVNKDGTAYDWSNNSEYNFGANARFIFSPKHEIGNAYHFGASATWENYSKEYKYYRHSTSINIHLENYGFRGLKTYTTRFPSSSTASFAPTSYIVFGGEFAGVYNSLSAQAEAQHFTLKNETPATGTGSVTNAKGEDKWWGFNAELAYVVTGESRDYNFKQGVIGGVTPNSERGAFELAARYSFLNMTGANVKNKSSFIGATYFDRTNDGNDIPSSYNNMWNLSVGGTWYANEFFSLKGNVVYHRLSDGHSKAFYNDDNKGHSLLAGAMRAQISW